MKIRVAGKVRPFVVTAMLLAGMIGGGVAAAGPAQAAAGCTVSINVAAWYVDANDQPIAYGPRAVGIGYLAIFAVTNTGAALHPWTASLLNPRHSRAVPGIYGATISRRVWVGPNTAWVVTAANYNADLPTGANASFGFRGIIPDPTVDGSNLVGGFALAGRSCTVV